ncbi:MAG: hypothetical protein LBT16_05790 [Treponema sp.]|jgi:hypothetical protein|nr:hypothetical protein [Treponema sp.]
MTLLKKTSFLMIWALAGVIATVMLMSCDLNGVDGNWGSSGGGGSGNTGDESVQLGDSVKDPNPRKFEVLDINNKYSDITAYQRAVGKKCEVWVDQAESVTAEQIAKIVNEFDNNIYGKLSGIFGDYLTLGLDVGKNLDVDKNGRLLLLLTDIKDTYTSEGDVFVAGYFSYIDLFAYEHSNGADMIVVDTNPGLSENPDTAYTTIAHEYQHLINFASMVYHRAKVEGQKVTLSFVDTWIDEGIASAAEYLYGGPVKSLIDWFNYDPMGTIARGNNFYVWGERSASIMDEYATVYLFFQWLRLQSGGVEIYKDIVKSPDYSDYRAVTAAAGARINSGYSDWAALLGDWFEANYRNDPSGLYGYKGEITTRVLAVKGGQYGLYSGEGVYGISSVAAPADSLPLKYIKISPDSAASLKDRILMYNANTALGTWNSGLEKYDYDIITGALPGLIIDETKPRLVASSVLSRSVYGNASEPHAIDIRDLIGRQNGGGVITLKRPEADNGQD